MWTEEMNAYLGDRWVAGDTMAAIVDGILATFHRTVSRSSVAGRIFRRKDLVRRRPNADGSRQAVPAPAPVEAKVRSPPVVRVELPKIVAPVDPAPVPLLELQDRSCRWLVGDDAYCGRLTAPRQSYCSGHARLALAGSSARRPPGHVRYLPHKFSGLTFRR